MIDYLDLKFSGVRRNVIVKATDIYLSKLILANQNH